MSNPTKKYPVPVASLENSLIDADPFADLTSRAPVVTLPPPIVRPKSSGHGQVRPAYTKPALAPRPSLPSLHTLAQMNVSIPGKKIRKGTPGARLPHEPWDNINPSSGSGTREITVASFVDETSCSRSLSGDDADMDSLPSLSSTHSPSTLSRSPSSPPVNSLMQFIDPSPHDEDDPLSYHSDFDYYTKSLSDLSDSELDPILTATPHTSLYSPSDDLDPLPSADTMHTASVTVPPPNLASHPWHEHTRVSEGPYGHARGRQTHRPDGACLATLPLDGRGKPHPPDYTSSSDDDADGVTVYYSVDGMSNGPSSRPSSRPRSRHSRGGAGSDDDIPLAQRVPGALSAQKSIRRQLHDERQQRRLERAKSSRAAPDPPLPSQPSASPDAPPRFRKRSLSAAPAPLSIPRTAAVEPFPVEDLTRKLISLQASSHTPHPSVPLSNDNSIPASASPRVPAYSSGVSRNSSRGKYADYTAYLQQKASRLSETAPQLRSKRSFHRPDGRHSETQRPPVNQTTAPRLGRSATTAASNRATRAGRDPATERHLGPGRISDDGRRPSATIPRSSIDRENDATQRAVQRPPVPPLPISDSTPPQLVSKVPVVQQRIFIGDMQRFNMVEITPATNAGDVIDTVARQGMLDRSGSWMVFELAQDYGMERPIRDYELLSDVSASWNKAKLLNAFVIKQTPLASLLSRSALPSSSPMHHGWVEWESRRGKWNKRWMELREHGLWLSKRDTGKDELFLCSLSNFDAYCITRRHKSPKPFVFAVKSTDHLSLFENTADYLHIFSCNPKDGEQWMQAILVARSYVLFQERNVLFTKTGESLSHVKPLVRSRTRKQSVSGRPPQPLVNVLPPFSQATTTDIAFEPGSLLAKRKGDTLP